MADFKFYDDVSAGFSAKSPGNPNKDIKYIPGEIVSSQCENVLFYPQSEPGKNRESLPGRIYCTNVRLSFIPYKMTETKLPIRMRMFDDRFDIPLVMVHKIFYSIADTSNGHITTMPNIESLKFKELTSSVSSMEIVSVMRIVLRDLRVLVIDLSDSQHAANLANHTLHFSRPASAQHIPQCGKLTGVVGRVLFTNAFEWENELKRSGILKYDKWRVAGLVSEDIRHPVHSFSRGHQRTFRYVNEVPSYPMYVIVCKEMVKGDLDRMIPQWRHGRFPIWIWSHHNGTSLLRSSFPNNNEIAEKLNEEVQLMIGRCSPERHVPQSIKIPLDYGPPRIAKAFDSLRKICALDSQMMLNGIDDEWLSLLNDSQWPKIISFCLKTTNDIVESMEDKRRSIIIYEEEGRDLSAVISALVQLCLVDEYRKDGDQLILLIAKEFCALGHPFGDRSLSNYGTTPTLLIFLDCIHQLIHQYPTEFAYSDHFLIALWDASIMGFLPSFTCNSAIDQNEFGGASGLCQLNSSSFLGKLFTPEYMDLFPNIWYEAAKMLEETNHSHYSPLRPHPSIANYEFWHKFFFRWIPSASIKNGGDRIAEKELDERLYELFGRDRMSGLRWRRMIPHLPQLKEGVSSFHPYSLSESSHHSPYPQPKDEDLETRSISGLSLSGFPGISKLVPSDDSRSLRPKLSIRLPKMTKKFHVSHHHQNQNDFPGDHSLP